ncbi:uncharacterized protein LOC110369307 [Fundulus heteroclitus]|uniref:uncharacterized protein LOC110369307 n=1 Tax=Fundulus heteroclitus TaxID=8078 RepID=UPI00165C54D7|nr:uncharacterized protein LOC110369307 [Fundulus heteroclitus]
MEMLQPGVLCAVILVFAVFQSVAECKVVIVGDQFIFPVNCKPGDSVTLYKALTDGGALQVATYDQHGGWKVMEEYSDRMISTSSGLVFTRTQYIDGGTYELNCSGRLELVQLEVVVASEKFVTEGETAVLPCYYDTDVWWWEKNGKLLCNSTWEAGCSGTSAGRRYGNLSLILENARLEDSGDYFCYFKDHGKQEPRTPVVVRLNVTKRKPHPTPCTCTAAPRNETPSGPEQTNLWKISTLVLGVLLLLLLFIIMLFVYGKFRRKLYEQVERNHQDAQPGEATTSV